MNPKREEVTIEVISRILLFAYYGVVFLTLFKKIQLPQAIFLLLPLPYIMLKVYGIRKYDAGNYFPLVGSLALHLFFAFYLIYK
ncbi:MAG: hypothetical protein KA713_14190 [Chryseotalea sp. WA131a]|jgi:hypothetical protein|nr:MAG: hypothetical protein KA713_14190 [Chryseotalea sp. WA131a]